MWSLIVNLDTELLNVLVGGKVDAVVIDTEVMVDTEVC